MYVWYFTLMCSKYMWRVIIYTWMCKNNGRDSFKYQKSLRNYEKRKKSMSDNYIGWCVIDNFDVKWLTVICDK